MSKYLFYLLLLLLVSCDYQKSQKDKYPKMPTFSEEISNPEKLNLKLLSGKDENIQAIFIKENRCITIGYVEMDAKSKYADSIVISDYSSLTDCKKYYFKIKRSKNNSAEDEVDQKSAPNISLYTVELIDDEIYTDDYKFSPPDYKPQLLDSLFWKNRGDKEPKPNITSSSNDEHLLEPFDDIVVGHTTNCGGGKLGPIICSVYLDYFKIYTPKKTIYFKEMSSLNQFKILNIFDKKVLLYLPRIFDKNTKLFIIND